MIEKIAIVADIHANKYALYKFLEYIDNKNIKCILNVGDLLIYWGIMKQVFLKLMKPIKMMKLHIDYGQKNK